MVSRVDANGGWPDPLGQRNEHLRHLQQLRNDVRRSSVAAAAMDEALAMYDGLVAELDAAHRARERALQEQLQQLRADARQQQARLDEAREEVADVHRARAEEVERRRNMTKVDRQVGRTLVTVKPPDREVGWRQAEAEEALYQLRVAGNHDLSLVSLTSDAVATMIENDVLALSAVSSERPPAGRAKHPVSGRRAALVAMAHQPVLVVAVAILVVVVVAAAVSLAQRLVP